MADKPKSADLHPGPGFRVRTEIDRAEATLVRELASFPTPDISDEMNRLYTMSFDIANHINALSFAGPALTIKVFPGDNLMVHKAIDLIEPGDVLIIDAGSSTNNAVIGDLIASKAKHKGAVGVIVDGLIRDVEALKEVDLPIYSKGITPIGPLHRGPGEVNYPVSCGGIVVNPGDIIVADMSGVVVVRRESARELSSRLHQSKKARLDYETSVKQGVFNNDWVDKSLDELRCHKE